MLSLLVMMVSGLRCVVSIVRLIIDVPMAPLAVVMLVMGVMYGSVVLVVWMVVRMVALLHCGDHVVWVFFLFTFALALVVVAEKSAVMVRWVVHGAMMSWKVMAAVEEGRRRVWPSMVHHVGHRSTVREMMKTGRWADMHEARYEVQAAVGLSHVALAVLAMEPAHH